jgi:hypothetical protein
MLDETSMTPLALFCRQVRNRSAENRTALELLHHHRLTGTVVSILRLELDSMVRCIFLGSITNGKYRAQLVEDSVHGRQWRTEDGKRKVTDRDMVEISNTFHGWTRNVYTFGCRFIHLSDFHDYADRDPFDSLTQEERQDIGAYLQHYHGLIVDANTKMREILWVLPRVFEKIAANLECCIRDLEAGSQIT